MTPSSKPKKPSRKSEQSVAPMSLLEFKAWLKGVEDMQGPDWSPNLEQWNLIQTRLHSIIEDVQASPVINTQVAIHPQPTAPHHPGLVPADQFFQQFQNVTPQSHIIPESPADVIQRALSAEPNGNTSSFV